MPASYVIDLRNGVVLSTAHGVLTDAEMLQHQTRLRSDPLFRPDLDQIFDFTNVDEADLSAAMVQRLADRNPFGAGSRRVFVVRTPVMLGMMRMYQMLSERDGDTLRVHVGTVAEARAMLNLGPSEGPV